MAKQDYRFPGLDRPLASTEIAIVGLLLVAAVAIAPYYNIVWPGGWTHGMILLTAGVLLAYLLVFNRTRFAGWVGRLLPGEVPLLKLLILGVACQGIIAALTRPILVSDPKAYLQLAYALAKGAPYFDEMGFHAFWPPGLPLFLTPFAYLSSDGLLATTLANMAMYVLGAWAIHDIGSRLFDRAVGTGATVLFTLWPARLLTAGIPSKENLTIAAMLVCTACLLRSRSGGESTAPYAWAVLGGIALGAASLAQPGLALLVVSVPIAYRHYLPVRLMPLVAWLACILLGLVMTVAPWMVRNAIVFDGAFWGISTNGGSVFYRANNPLATGNFLPRGEVDLSNLPELEQNATGTRLAKEWIASNPTRALRLSVWKIAHLVGSDDYGPYWAVLRGLGESDESATRNATPQRAWLFRATNLLALAFWVAVCALAATALLRALRTGSHLRGEWSPLLYPMLYSLAVFAIMESGARQHMAAIAPILVLAAACARSSVRDAADKLDEHAGIRARGA